jgi:hypothetical protein
MFNSVSESIHLNVRDGLSLYAIPVQDSCECLLCEFAVSEFSAAQAGNKSALLGHLSSMRGYLGEACALLACVWRAKHRSALQEAKAIVRKMGPDYEVLPLSQLENNIRLSLKEGADQMIVIINRKRGEAITFLSAQVKTANTSEEVEQTINDVVNREFESCGSTRIRVRG